MTRQLLDDLARSLDLTAGIETAHRMLEVDGTIDEPSTLVARLASDIGASTNDRITHGSAPTRP